MLSRSALAATRLQRAAAVKPAFATAAATATASEAPRCAFSTTAAAREADTPASPRQSNVRERRPRPPTDASSALRACAAQFNSSNKGAGAGAGISRSSDGSDGSAPGPILRAPRGFKLLQSNLKRMAGGALNTTAGRTGGGRPGPNKRKPGGGAGQQQRQRARQQGQRRRKREESYDEEDEYANLTAEQERAVLAQLEAARPKPQRYHPRGETVASLLPTWPALPVGATAQRQTVLGTLDAMGARFANGFEAPSDLARRLLDGKAVRFRDDEEKRRAMQIAREMLAERAVEGGEAGEAEGDGKAPPELHFQAVDDKACADMLDRLVAGSYAGKAPPVPANASPALRDTIRMLKNNETYQSEDIQKFVGLLNKALPPARPRT